MAREASEARRRTATEASAPGSRLLLDAAFLVAARRATAFRSALRRNARKLGAPGIVVSLTGPWPPYNFIDAGDSPRGANRTKHSAVKTASATAAAGQRTRPAAPRGRTARSGAR